jgi:hypothetical protein
MIFAPWMNLTFEMARLGMATQQQWLRMGMTPVLNRSSQAAQAATRNVQEAAGVMIGAGISPAQAGLLRNALKTYRRHQRRQRQHQSS